MGCSNKQFKNDELCAGDLDKEIEFMTRALGTPGPNDTVPPLTLTLIKLVFCGITTVKGSAKFAKVNIDDRPTHIFTVRFDPDILDIETANTFVRFNNGFSIRLFRIIDIEINNEGEHYLDVLCTERGVETQSAALA